MLPRRIGALAAAVGLAALSWQVQPLSAHAQGAGPGGSAAAGTIPASPAEALAHEIAALRQQLKAQPKDSKLRMQLADALRKSGRSADALKEYIDITEDDATQYAAFHHIAQMCDDMEEIDDAIERLIEEKDKHPRELMLRVALSELLEKRRNYYQAARALIDLMYENAIPEKHRPRVNARIHYLLTKAKDAQLAEKVDVPDDADLDVVPAPLPEVSLHKALTATKVKETKEMKGVGRVPLLP